jgi:naphthoate synthase
VEDSLHVVCDLTLASKEHAILSKPMMQTSFDGGYGSGAMVGQKKHARFLRGTNYSASDAMVMGMVNAVIPHS